MKTRMISTGLIILAAAAQWYCSDSGSALSPPKPEAAAPALAVKTIRVSTADWPVTVPLSGSLRSQSNVEIKSEVAGKLIATPFREGDAVRKGEMLAEIDPINYRLALDQAQAALGVAQAGLERIQVSLDYARREKERADNLLRTGGITERDHQAAVNGVKEAETQARLAQAQIEQARTVVTIAEKALKDCRIFAPADGQVRRRFLDVGSLLTPGTPVYSLVDNARLELECQVPSYQLAGIRLGHRAVFTTPSWGDRRFEGRVSAINPMVEAENRSVKVIVNISNPNGELRSGMFARGDIEVRTESKALVIPRSALMVEQEQSSSGSVYLVVNGRAVRRAIQVGGVRQDQLWIQSGLAAGDQVIVDIGPALKDGAAVNVTNELETGGR